MTSVSCHAVCEDKWLQPLRYEASRIGIKWRLDWSAEDLCKAIQDRTQLCGLSPKSTKTTRQHRYLHKKKGIEIKMIERQLQKEPTSRRDCNIQQEARSEYLGTVENNSTRGMLPQVRERKIYSCMDINLAEKQCTASPRTFRPQRVRSAFWNPVVFKLPALQSLKYSLKRGLAPSDQGCPNGLLGFLKSQKSSSDEAVEAAARDPKILAAFRTVDNRVKSLQQLLCMETAPGLKQVPDRSITGGIPVTTKNFVNYKVARRSGLK